MHHQPYTLNSKHSAERGLQEDICKIIEKADVNHVLAAHNHNFQQSTILKCNDNGKWERIFDTDPKPLSILFLEWDEDKKIHIQ